MNDQPDLSWVTARYLNTTLRAVCAEHPAWVNPVDDVAAVPYSVYDDGCGRHCLIGHCLQLLGVDTSEIGSTLAADYVLKGLGVPLKVTLAVRSDLWQANADMGPVEWGQVARSMIRMGGL